MPRLTFDIFLSSTSADLQACRIKVGEMIARMRQTAIRMETFGARPNMPLATCRGEVQRCDALIVIVGHRYGWVPSKGEGGDGFKSITWWEVQWALDAYKPVYAFLIDAGAEWTGQREQDRLLSAENESTFIEIGQAVQRLQEFRTFLDRNTTREVFTSADDLGGKVASSLHDWLLEQAVAAARAAYPPEATRPLQPVPKLTTKAGETGDVECLYWQEQIHFLAARRVVEGTEGVRIALISGRANTNHPALSGASIRQIDARRHVRESPPDDFTTALAALLVGNGNVNLCSGIAAQAHLLVLHVLDDEYMSSNVDILAALDAAVREGAQVVCLPLAGTVHSEFEQAAYRRAADLGTITVCGAGNLASDEPVHPAAYPDCISAGAVDAYNRLAVFSNFGDWVTSTAPGTDIPVAVGKDGYAKLSGTSFSCGILAGIIALMVKANPAITLDRVKKILRTAGPHVLSAEGSELRADLRMLDAYEAVKAAAASA